jgi:Zn-dependent protease
MKFLLFLSFFPGFQVALTVHEAAHALVSKWLGDRYAERQGRVSLNPMRHLSVVGTLMLFVLGFGWGKPVPVNLYNYKRPKLDYLLCSLAGPASNILLGIISIAMMYGLNFICQTEPGKAAFSPAGQIAYALFWAFLYSLLYINAILAVINLLPIPPLDGSKIWPCLFPQMRASFSGKATWIWIIILIMVMRGDMLNKYLIGPAIHFTDSLVPAMLVKQASLPSDFPAEVRAPDSPYPVCYDSTANAAGEPNAFMVSFCIHEPYPAIKYRRQLAEKLAGMGWSRPDVAASTDPNIWKMSDVIEDEDGSHKALIWAGIWEKEGNKFFAEITYCTDVEGKNPESAMGVELKYAIEHPEITK